MTYIDFFMSVCTCIMGIPHINNVCAVYIFPLSYIYRTYILRILYRDMKRTCYTVPCGIIADVWKEKDKRISNHYLINFLYLTYVF